MNQEMLQELQNTIDLQKNQIVAKKNKNDVNLIVKYKEGTKVTDKEGKSTKMEVEGGYPKQENNGY